MSDGAYIGTYWVSRKDINIIISCFASIIGVGILIIVITAVLHFGLIRKLKNKICCKEDKRDLYVGLDQ